jgi:hypothetical protein
LDAVKIVFDLIALLKVLQSGLLTDSGVAALLAPGIKQACDFGGAPQL